MRLFIPRYGQKLTLTADWSFALYFERRNYSLLEHHGVPFRKLRWEDTYEPQKPGEPPCKRVLKHVMAKIPAGTELTVDRVYVRMHDGNASDFDSMSFRATLDKTKVRFWAKLADCNCIDFEVASQPKTAPEFKPNPKTTDDVKVGDIVTIDHATFKHMHPGGYLPCWDAKLEKIVVRMSRDNICVINSDSSRESFPKEKIFLLKKRGEDIAEWVIRKFRNQYDAKDWSADRQKAFAERVKELIAKMLADKENTTDFILYALRVTAGKELARASMEREKRSIR